MDASERRILLARLERHHRFRRSYSDTMLALVPMRHKISVAPEFLASYPRGRTALEILEEDNARCRQQSECLCKTAGNGQPE